ncbi:MAG: GNAT family N-acetyltransferase [Candidatus Dependentiae bacterium]
MNNNSQYNLIKKSLLIATMVTIGSGISYWYIKKPKLEVEKTYVIYPLANDQRDIDDILQLFKDEIYALTTADYDDVHAKLMRRSYNINDPSKDGTLLFYVMRDKKTDAFIGFLAIHRMTFYKGKILFLAVKPEFRGKRYAGELVKFAFDTFREMGMIKAMLTTRVDNVAGQKAYEREGFKKYQVYDGFVYYEVYL